MPGVESEEDLIFSGGEPTEGATLDDGLPIVETPDDRAMSEAIQNLQRGNQQKPDSLQAPAQPAKPSQAPQPELTWEQEREQLRKENQELARQRDGILRDLQQQRKQGQQPEPKPVPVGDRLFTEPEAVLQDLESRIDQKLAGMALQSDINFVRQADPDRFDEAYQAFYSRVSDRNNPDPLTYFRVVNAPSFGQALLEWHKEQTTLREYSDPDAVRARMREEILAELQGGGQQSAAPQPARQADGKFAPKHEVRLPKSPSRLPGGSSVAAEALDGSEEAIYAAGRRR